MRLLLFCIVTIITATTQAQDNTIFERLSALNNGMGSFYNLDGYTISSQTFNYPFTEKGLKKVYRKYKIKKDEIKIADETFSFKNFYVTKDERINDSLSQNNAYYFIENKYERITVIQFSAINKRDKVLERQLMTSIVERSIPPENYQSQAADSINFAGRKIELGGVCQWMQINSVQCPGYGQINWSVHKELKSAQEAIANQLAVTLSQKNGKVISEEPVNIIFEGTETVAKKVIYDFTGVTSLLASMSGGKTLTIFYVAAPVRGNYVSCVLSYWNNDTLSETGLAPLLDEVMVVKK